MMIRPRWLIVAIVIFLVMPMYHAAAATNGLLYQVHRAGDQAHAPGRPVPGINGLRVLTSSDQRSLLTIPERRSLQASVTYHAMFTPNDPLFSLQWNLQTMHVPAAWDVDQTSPFHGGDPRIIVAVLDTGLASTVVGGAQSAPDIAASTIWTNTKEIAGDGIDNDADGYVDDTHGWNFVSNNARPADNNGHGTHISSVIASATDNAMAIAGVASNVTIMPLKVLDQDGNGTTVSLTGAVNYAISHGASIINLSLGGDEDDPLLHQAIQAAVAQGIIVIGAAGNGGVDSVGDPVVTFPAKYSEVISVGATNTDGTRASYSNYGTDLTLVAPGGNTDVDLNGDGQRDGIPAQTCEQRDCTSFLTVYMSGTSQAASEVTAVAALLESCGAAAGNVRSLLTSSATDLGTPGRDDVFGAGQVDAAAALTAAGCVTSAPASPNPITAAASATSALAVYINRPSPYAKPVFSWSGAIGSTYAVTWKKGSSTLSNIRQTASTFSPTIQSEGSYALSVAAVDALGQISTPTTFVYRYQKPAVVMSSGSTISLLRPDFSVLRSLSASVGSQLSVGAGALGPKYINSLLVAAQPRGPSLSLLTSTGLTQFRIKPFGSAYSGTIGSCVVNLADGTTKIVAATATNGASLAWFSSSGQLVGRNLVFAKYIGGLTLACGDLDGDGNDEVIVGQAAGPEIRVYSAEQKRTAVFRPRGSAFRQGWSLTVGDTNGDGRAEILAAPNIPTKTLKVLVLNSTGHELQQFNVAGSTVSPMNLQAADLQGDGKIQLLTSPRRGTGVLQVLQLGGHLLRQVKLSATLFRSLSRL